MDPDMNIGLVSTSVFCFLLIGVIINAFRKGDGGLSRRRKKSCFRDANAIAECDEIALLESRQPPGPPWPSMPVIGQSYLFLKLDGSDVDVVAKFVDFGKRYGPVYRFDVGPWPTLVVSGRDEVAEALRHPDLQGRPYNLMPSMRLMMGGEGVDGALPGFAGSQGRNWHEQRRFFVTHLRQSFEQINEIVAEEAEKLADSLESQFDPDEVEMEVAFHRFFMPATVNIVWRLATGKKLDYKNPDLSYAISKVYDFFAFLESRPKAFAQLQYPFLMRLAAFLGMNTGLNTYTEMLRIIRKKLEEQRKSGRKNSLTNKYLDHTEVSATTSSFHGDLGLNNLVCMLGDIFMGGSDTTNNQMEWAMLYLAYNPDWQERIRDSSHLIEPFLLEVLRLRPIAPLALPRLATEDCVLAGFRVEKNTQVLADLSSTLRNEEIFPSPEEFNPLRFLPAPPSDRIQCERVRAAKEIIGRNFGLGRRACPGEKIARAEMTLFLEKLLQKFSFHPPAGLDTDSTFQGIYGLNHVPRQYKLIVKRLKKRDE